MGLLTARPYYKPFEYEQAYDYWLKQQQAFWTHLEIGMSGDINDWKTKLSEKEKELIGTVLKGFTQSELFIEDYWGNKVANWFKKPEIQMMANAFASFESIHAVSYAYLNDSLGLDDYKAFMHDEAIKNKIDRLINTRGKSKEDIAKSLAIFSAFNEGVNLFSSFAILMSFQRRNLLKGMGQIIAFSIRDETLHSEAGCWLFRLMTQEYPEVFTDELKKELYDAARLTVQLEDVFIDKAFGDNDEISGISKGDLKNYIRFRTNTKLQDLGLKSNWKNVDKESIKNLQWFSVLSSGEENADFFANRVTTYGKDQLSFDDIF